MSNHLIESQKVLHPVESLTHLYRARRFWHTPELDQAISKIIKHFGDRESIPLEFITEFMQGMRRHGLPDCDSWKTFYEPCPVVKTTPMEIVVVSQNMPPDILERFPDFYAGGKFHINKARLQRDGKALHTRHGDYFYVAVPDVAIALVECLKQLEVVK